jgi:hypothetical protein
MLKKLPPVLLVALGLELVTTIAWILGHSLGSTSVRWNLALDGAGLVSDVLGIAGFLELSRRTTGRESLGLRVTAAAFGLAVAVSGFWQVVTFVQPHWGEHTWDVLSRWTWYAPSALSILGLAVAASQRHRAAACAAAAVFVVCVPFPPLAKAMYGWIDGWKAVLVLHDALHAIAVVAMIVLAALVCGGEPARAPDAATAGLRTIAAALWLRVIAAVTVAGLTLLLVVGKAGEGSAGVLKLAMMSGAVVNAISLVMLVRGALGAVRAGIADLPRWPFVASAAGTLWCLGVALYQLPYTYRLLYGDHDYAFSTSDLQDTLQALSIAAPLVALGAVAIIATAIAGFAARRGLDQLRAEAQGKGAAFVALDDDARSRHRRAVGDGPDGAPVHARVRFASRRVAAAAGDRHLKRTCRWLAWFGQCRTRPVIASLPAGYWNKNARSSSGVPRAFANAYSRFCTA